MKKNTIGKKIVGIATAAIMTVSTVAVSAVTAFAAGPNNNRPIVSFEPCGNWGEAGAQMKAYFYNSVNSAETTVDLKVFDNKLYTEAPVGYDKVVFMRQNPANNEIWNQTYDLSIEAGKTYKATSFNGKYYVGEWQGEQQKDQQKEQKTEPSKKFNEVHFAASNEWKSSGARFMAYAYKEGTDKSEWLKVSRISPYSTHYNVNVPTEYTHVIFVRLPGDSANSFDNAWNKTCNIRVSKLSNCYQINGWELDKDADGYNEFWS